MEWDSPRVEEGLHAKSLTSENADCREVLASEVRFISHESDGFEGLETGSKAKGLFRAYMRVTASKTWKLEAKLKVY